MMKVIFFLSSLIFAQLCFAAEKLPNPGQLENKYPVFYIENETKDLFSVRIPRISAGISDGIRGVFGFEAARRRGLVGLKIVGSRQECQINSAQETFLCQLTTSTYLEIFGVYETPNGVETRRLNINGDGHLTIATSIIVETSPLRSRRLVSLKISGVVSVENSTTAEKGLAINGTITNVLLTSDAED